MSTGIFNYGFPLITTGFSNKYIVNYVGINAVSTNLNDSTFINNIKYLFTDPSQFFVSLYAYPFSINHYASVVGHTGIEIGNTALSYRIPIQCFKFVNNYQTAYKLNTITIDRVFNNFLDYSPYRKLELYIPYCNFVTLDTNLVMGKTLDIYYSIDFDTGGCTAYITMQESSTTSTLIATAKGQIGFEIPIGSSNANENSKRLLLSTISAGVSLASMGVAGPTPATIGGLTGSAVSMFQALQEKVYKGNLSGGKDSLVSPNQVYLIDTRAVPSSDQMDYVNFKGLPLYKAVDSLEDLTGFTTLNDFHLDNFGTATETEINEIDTLLKTGIIL